MLQGAAVLLVACAGRGAARGEARGSENACGVFFFLKKSCHQTLTRTCARAAHSMETFDGAVNGTCRGLDYCAKNGCVGCLSVGLCLCLDGLFFQWSLVRVDHVRHARRLCLLLVGCERVVVD